MQLVLTKSISNLLDFYIIVVPILLSLDSCPITCYDKCVVNDVLKLVYFSNGGIEIKMKSLYIFC